jgi:hypothetical protein
MNMLHFQLNRLPFGKKTILLICLGVISFRLSAQEPENHPLKIFILAGQSNAVGYNNIKEFHAGKRLYRKAFHKQRGILFWPGSNARTGFAGRWVKLQIGISDISAQAPFHKGCYGPEIGFGETITKAFPEVRIAIIKYAVGATGIARSKDYHDYIPALKGFNDKGRNWHPGSDGGDMGILYKNLMDNIHAALDLLTQQGRTYELSGFIWMQGEHESGISKTMANDYGSLLTLFVNAVRKDLGVRNLPFVIGEVNSYTWAFADIGRKQQEAACRNGSNCLLIKTTDLPRNGIGGPGHFDADGMLILGNRFAGGMLDLLSRK